MKRLESKLNLTDTQKDQIEKLRLDHQKAMVDLKANLEKARIELREIIRKDDFTRNEYLAAHTKMAKLREEIQLAGANHRMDVLDLMNKDQRKIMAENRLLNAGKKNFGKKGRGNRQLDKPKMRQRIQNY
jgi:Spy/CpxP family protein refolding chaperone